MTMDRPATRLPVKLHRGVCLVVAADAVAAEEVLARKKVAPDVCGRLADNVLLLRPGRAEAVAEELRRSGLSPRVIAPTPADA